MLEFAEVQSLSYSFKNICRIDYLTPFRDLTKLQLDNNIISKIEGLDHLVHLTWLDLSFNNITKIEGLDALTKLEDLSLHNNAIETLEGMDAFRDVLVSLSIGNNKLETLEGLMYLRTLPKLRLVNLAGNPVCEEEDYKPYVLSHVRGLKYLDHRIVRDEAVAAAREQYADEMTEIETREEEATHAAKRAEELAARDAAHDEANILGVVDLFRKMLDEDPEYARLRRVPTETDHPLVDGVEAFEEKYVVHMEEFKHHMTQQLEKKRAEEAEWRGVLDGAMGELDEEARNLVIAFDKEKKRAFRAAADMSDAEFDETRARLTARNDELKEELMRVENRVLDVVGDLIFEFDRNYSDITDKNKSLIANFFVEVRGLEDLYYSRVMEASGTLLEKFGGGELDDPEKCTDEARALLGDKDAFLNACQAHHDFHVNVIDALEDKLSTGEKRRLDKLIGELRAWERMRNRERVTEIAATWRRHAGAIEAEFGDGEEDA